MVKYILKDVDVAGLEFLFIEGDSNLDLEILTLFQNKNNIVTELYIKSRNVEFIIQNLKRNLGNLKLKKLFLEFDKYLDNKMMENLDEVLNHIRCNLTLFGGRNVNLNLERLCESKIVFEELFLDRVKV